MLQEAFPGELRKPWDNGDLIVVKAHQERDSIFGQQFDRYILVVRNALDSYKAEYMRRKTGENHTAVLSKLDQECKS